MRKTKRESTFSNVFTNPSNLLQTHMDHETTISVGHYLMVINELNLFNAPVKDGDGEMH